MTQKIALLSDVHGNRTALEAVLKDAKNNGVTECWFLGDLIMPGPGGNELFELLESNNTTVFIKGNWDDCFLEVLNDPQNINLADSSDVYVGILSKYTKIHLKKTYIELLNSLNIVERRNIFGLDVSISHNLPEKTTVQSLWLHPTKVTSINLSKMNNILTLQYTGMYILNYYVTEAKGR